jgi:hypothetical protein
VGKGRARIADVVVTRATVAAGDGTGALPLSLSLLLFLEIGFERVRALGRGLVVSDPLPGPREDWAKSGAADAFESVLDRS